MPKVNLSRMTVEALMDLRKRVDDTLLKRRGELQQQLERIAVGGARGGGSPFEGKESPAEISKPLRRNLGRSWRKTSLACRCDQRWKEAR
jgi:hypothetical protein